MKMHRLDNRDPNCLARNTTKWFGWAFTMDRRARLVGQANCDTEDELLAHFRSVASGPRKIHYWPPGMNPTRRVVVIEPPQQRQVG
jgi:hypothetical protein